MTHQKDQKIKSKNQNSQSNKNPNDWAKYTAIAAKMIAVILAGTFGGRKLDEYLQLKTPIFTLILSLVSTGLAIYIIIRDVGK